MLSLPECSRRRWRELSSHCGDHLQTWQVDDYLDHPWRSLQTKEAESWGEKTNNKKTLHSISQSTSGFIKIHKLLYESCPEVLQVLDSIESCPSAWKIPAAALIGFAENFSSKAEEISMECIQDGVTFKTFKNPEERGSGPSASYSQNTLCFCDLVMNQSTRH